MPLRQTLSVPIPCHENWQAMTPAAQGRHCAACATTVVDFSRMTDAEVIAYLGQAAGKSCGRFRQDQLGRPLTALAPSASRWQIWLAATTVLLGLRTALAPPIRAQQRVLEQQHITLGMVAQSTIPQVFRTLPLRIRGRITDRNGDGLPGVTVIVKNTAIQASTNTDGLFEIHLPAEQTTPIVLVVSSIGYISKEVISNPSSPIELTLDADVKGRFEVASDRWYTPRHLWQRLTRPFRRH